MPFFDDLHVSPDVSSAVIGLAVIVPVVASMMTRLLLKAVRAWRRY